MTEFNHEKLKKILYEWRCKPEWEEWKRLGKERQDEWIKAVNMDYKEIGYPDPETAVARALIRD